MDEKLSAVLGNKELMEKIAALVNGAPADASTPPAEVPALSPVTEAAPASLPLMSGADKGLALLAALRPFLKENRRKKLDAATSALSVASVYRNIKKI